MMMPRRDFVMLHRVPEIAIILWIMKIIVTTLVIVMGVAAFQAIARCRRMSDAKVAKG